MWRRAFSAVFACGEWSGPLLSSETNSIFFAGRRPRHSDRAPSPEAAREGGRQRQVPDEGRQQLRRRQGPLRARAVLADQVSIATQIRSLYYKVERKY